MNDPENESWGERVEDLLEDADNSNVSDEEYERRRAELLKEKEAEHGEES